MSLLATCFFAESLGAQDEFISREQQIKAAYLYNFGRYVDWPGAADTLSPEMRTNFVVGVLGDDPLAEELAKIARQKTLREKQIVVHRIRHAGEYRPCHLLFVSAGPKQELIEGVLDQTKSESVLIVSDSMNLAPPGAVIMFYSEDNKLRFEINVEAARRRNLQISSKLLQVGKLVGSNHGYNR